MLISVLFQGCFFLFFPIKQSWLLIFKGLFVKWEFTFQLKSFVWFITAYFQAKRVLEGATFKIQDSFMLFFSYFESRFFFMSSQMKSACKKPRLASSLPVGRHKKVWSSNSVIIFCFSRANNFWFIFLAWAFSSPFTPSVNHVMFA